MFSKDIYTQKNAYENVTSSVRYILEKIDPKVKYPEFYKNINLYEYIVPNLFYDKTHLRLLKMKC